MPRKGESVPVQLPPITVAERTGLAACRDVGPDDARCFTSTAVEPHDLARRLEIALKFCRDCPVRRACGELADSMDERDIVGMVWGGRLR